jgi:carboxymethylenebutenolidase
MQRRASGRNTSVGQGQVVDEMVIRFTHSVRMHWLLPGIPPTGKRVEVPFVGIIRFAGDKIVHEHLYERPHPSRWCS